MNEQKTGAVRNGVWNLNKDMSRGFNTLQSTHRLDLVKFDSARLEFTTLHVQLTPLVLPLILAYLLGMAWKNKQYCPAS